MLTPFDLRLKPFSANPSQKAHVIERVQAILSGPDSPDVPRLETEIDQLVYGLYGLTEEEIGIVEGRNTSEMSQKRDLDAKH